MRARARALEFRENAVVSAAILCLAACACDVMNTAGMTCGAQVSITSRANFFLFFTGKGKPTWLRPLRSLHWKQGNKKYCCCMISIQHTHEACKENYLLILLRFQASFLLRFGSTLTDIKIVFSFLSCQNSKPGLTEISKNAISNL